MAVMVILSALGVNVAICILAGLLVFGLTALGPRGLGLSMLATLTDIETWDITVSVALIAILGSVMRELGQLDDIMEGLRGLGVRGRPLMALSSTLMGLLPVPGGAILSASVVEEEGRSMGADERGSATANLLFRHLNFFAYPLSPALIFLASSEVLGIGMPILMLALLPASLAHIVSSSISSFYGMKPSRPPSGSGDTDRKACLMRLLRGLTPILIAPILGALGLGLSASICVSLATSLLLAGLRGGLGDLLNRAAGGLRKSKAYSFALPILFAMMFRRAFKSSGISGAFGGLLSASPLPEGLTLCLLALVLGLATGTVTLPVITVLPPDVGLLEGVMAYTGAVTGYIISPLHLCFILTAEYFGLRQAKMYPRLLAYAVLTLSISLPLTLALAGFLP